MSPPPALTLSVGLGGGGGCCCGGWRADLKPWYEAVLRADQLRVLIYNGDADPAVQAPGVEAWAQSLGLPVAEGWRPWALKDSLEVGGYVTAYAHNFSFATVRGAGHMVPLYRPQAAHEMITRFVHGEALRHYHGSFPSFQCAARLGGGLRAAVVLTAPPPGE